MSAPPREDPDLSRVGPVMRHVVMFSSGITSWAVARLVVDLYGSASVTLLFADTLAEDEDNYRFNDDAAALLGVPITRVCDGRTPQDVNRDANWLGNAQLAPCSHRLKQIPCRRWLTDNTDPSETVVYVGLDWSEPHRKPAVQRAWHPWPTRFPLEAPPYYPKEHWLREARAQGLEPPQMYRLGFEHANCGGACVRAGQAQWAHLLRVGEARFAERFTSWEKHEDEMCTRLGKPVAVLRDRRDGQTKPLPLSVLRERLHAADSEQPGFDRFDWGGCGCFTTQIPDERGGP